MFKGIFEFNDLIDRIANCFDWYCRKRFEDTRYNLFLSNGDNISIEFNRRSVPHLLGINVDFLRSTGLYKGNAYEILEEIITNSDRLYSQIKNGYLSRDNVFSKYIDKKLNNFKNICGINIFDIEFVVDYSSKNSYITGQEKLDGDYYIATRINYDTLSIVGFRCGDNVCFPITNVELDLNSKEARSFLFQLLSNQSLTTVQTLKKDTFLGNSVDSKSFYYNNDVKMRKLGLLENYADDYNCRISTNRDCMFYLNKVSNLYASLNSLWLVLEEITGFIESGKPIDKAYLENKYDVLKPSVVKLIDAYNSKLPEFFDNKSLIDMFVDAKSEIAKLNDLYSEVSGSVNRLSSDISDIEFEKEDLQKRNKVRK